MSPPAPTPEDLATRRARITAAKGCSKGLLGNKSLAQRRAAHKAEELALEEAKSQRLRRLFR
jgi:hypothetical protein